MISQPSGYQKIRDTHILDNLFPKLKLNKAITSSHVLPRFFFLNFMRSAGSMNNSSNVTHSSSSVLRVSVAQTCAHSYALKETMDKLVRLARLAKERDGSQLIVFPEALYVIRMIGFVFLNTDGCSIGGYPKFSTFGAVVGDRSKEGRDEFLRYHKAAVEIPSSVTENLESISKELQISLVVGVIERDGGTLYCTTVFIDPTHGYLGKHRKLAPTATERIIWGQGDATTLPVYDLRFESSGAANNEATNAKICAAICW